MLRRRSAGGATRVRRRDHLNHGAAEDNGWSQGLPDMVEEVLVNVLPQEDALRLRLVSSHWARSVAFQRRSLKMSLLEATLPRRRRWQRGWPERVVARFGGLRSLSVHLSRQDWARVDKAIMFSALSTLPFLHDLTWHDCDLLDSDLALVGQLTGLRHLDLLQTCGTTEHHNQAASVRSTSALTGMLSLRSLSLQRFSFLPDHQLAALRGLSNLTSLNLCECQVNDGVLAALTSSLTGLTVLDITWPMQLSASGLTHLKRLSSLTELAVGGCYNLEVGWMSVLGTLSRLTKLRLHELDIDDEVATDENDGSRSSTDAQLASLGALPQLTFIDLSYNLGLSDTGLAALSRLTGLRDLDLSCSFGMDTAGAALRGHGLASLGAGLSRLQRLDLSRCMQVSDDGLACLESAASLTWLLLNHCIQLTDAALSHIARLPRLRVVGLADVAAITAGGIASLPASLEVLNIAGCSAILRAATGKRALGTALGGFLQLQELHFGWSRSVFTGLRHKQTGPSADAVLASTLAHMGSLEKLYLHHSDDVTAAGVTAAIAPLHKLSCVVFLPTALPHYHTTGIFSQEDCMAIKAAHPNRPRLQVDTRCCSLSSEYNHL